MVGWREREDIVGRVEDPVVWGICGGTGEVGRERKVCEMERRWDFRRVYCSWWVEMVAMMGAVVEV